MDFDNDALIARDQALDGPALAQLFHGARTFNAWQDRGVADETLRALYDLLKFPPTSANQNPGRFLFLKGQAKEQLRPFLMDGNVAKTMAAPVTVVVAWDWAFVDRLPELFPQAPEAKTWFDADAARQEHGFRNGTLQGAYLILAARALGLDCGPMSGFDNAGVDATFFKSDPEMALWRSNFLVNLGYGTTESLHPRLPRLPFESVARILS